MRVAVIIPLYNKAPYVERALRSVFAQTRLPDEVIVIDDGSTDKGSEIVQKLAGDRVQLVVQRNKGVACARNHGVRKATADAVAFLDADDEWDPRFLDRCLTAFQMYPQAVAVFTAFSRSDAPSRNVDRSSGNPILIENYFDFAIRRRDREMCSSAVVVRREILLRTGGFPEGIHHGEDTDTWIRVAWMGSVVHIPEYLAMYHQDDVNSLTRRVVPDAPHPTYATFLDWYRSGRIRPELVKSSRKFVSLRNRYVARLLVHHGHRRAALKTLIRHCSPTPFLSQYLRLWLLCLLPDPVAAALRRTVQGVRRWSGTRVQ